MTERKLATEQTPPGWIDTANFTPEEARRLFEEELLVEMEGFPNNESGESQSETIP